ncbi:MAG: carbohydrate kinase family protein [Limnochordaceae bacterium]|nr:carbohydrate kinase family protein [Limnochordaceae bacterium]
MKQASDVTVLGELNPDIVLSRVQGKLAPGRERVVEDAIITIGSSSAICATILSRLGIRVRFVGMVGADWFGRFMVEALKDEGIATSVKVDPSVKTGVTVAITGTDERMLITFPGAMAAMKGGDVDLEAVLGSRHLHTGSFFLQTALQHDLPAILRRAVEAGMTTSLDPGHDPAERWAGLENVLPWVTVLMLNEVELLGIARTLTGDVGIQNPRDAARAVCETVREMVVVKRGKDGAFAVSRDGRLVESPPFRVDPVDTTGAGDAFDAGFIVQWLAGAPVENRLAFANACGAIATTYPGGTPGFPSLERVMEFMAQRGRGIR